MSEVSLSARPIAVDIHCPDWNHRPFWRFRAKHTGGPYERVVKGDDLLGGIGLKLREARLARGYSLEDVAETSGLTKSEVLAVETGKDMEPRRLERIASAVGLTGVWRRG